MKDGGSVFPVYGEGRFGETGEFSSGMECESHGMTLRDYFAGQALIGLLSNPDLTMPEAEKTGVLPYKIADAMLAEREKENA